MVDRVPIPAPQEPPAKPAGLAAAAQVISPDRVRLREDEFCVFHLAVDGKEYADVRPVRAFPVSGKADYIGFMNAQGKEVALVAHPHKLDKASRKALDHALSRMYYIPKILRIDEITETWGVSHWKAQTNCGYANFEVIDREYIRTLGPGHFLIVDADGNRFEIEDASKLDEKSRELLHTEV